MRKNFKKIMFFLFLLRWQIIRNKYRFYGNTRNKKAFQKEKSAYNPSKLLSEQYFFVFFTY